MGVRMYDWLCMNLVDHEPVQFKQKGLASVS